ncbi:MAG: serine protease [Cyanobacteria bacterium K_DeepCast_35m_m2_023]|nr:serine protease [Cyanobacteria bacterium K_DeepCast_35m_m2_023]
MDAQTRRTDLTRSETNHHNDSCGSSLMKHEPAQAVDPLVGIGQMLRSSSYPSRHSRRLRFIRTATLTGLLVLVACLPAKQVFGQDNTSQDLELARSIVKIFGGGAAGSGVSINNDDGITTVLTAAHVIEGTQVKEEPYVQTADGRTLVIIEIELFRPLDLAEIKVKGRIPSVKQLGSPHGGGAVRVIGFPQNKMLPSIRYGLSEAQATDPTSRAGGYGIAYNAKTEVGMSGGGVFNQNNELIGIHGEADTLKTVSGIRYKQGISLAVPLTFWPRYKASGGAKSPVKTDNTKTPDKQCSNQNISLRQLMTNGQFAVAEQKAGELISCDPQDSSHHASRGLIRMQMKNYNEALVDFDNAIRLSAKNAKLFLNRGNALFRLGRSDEAIDAYSTALQLNPNWPLALLSRAQAHASQDNLKKAALDLNQAEQLEPHNGLITLEIAELERRQGNYSKAFDAANRAIELMPDAPKPLALRGVINGLMGNYSQGIKDMDEAIDFNDNVADYYDIRGNHYYELGQYKEALEDFKKALDLDKTRASTAANIGETLFVLGDKKKGCKYYKTASDMRFQWVKSEWNPNFLKHCSGQAGGSGKRSAARSR